MRFSRMVYGLFAGFLALAAAAPAQTTDLQSAGQAVADSVQQGMTFSQIMEYGGWLMYPLIALSVLSLSLIVYFVVVLREETALPRKFVSGVQDLLESGRLMEAREACRSNPSAIAAVVGEALQYSLRAEKPDGSVLREIVESEGSRQATLIQNQIQYLVDIVAVAPMIGLLGTVVGMLKAFNTVALDLAKAKPMLLAAGVSQALITTVAGLCVAIPAAIAFAYFRGRSSKIIANLETTAAELSALLVREK